MGQLALGFRSLFIKAGVFFVMAGLLAWALGGTLFPKPTIVNLSGAGEVHWQVASGGEIHGLQWTLMRGKHEIKSGHWQAAIGPVVVDGELWVATGNANQWKVSKVTDDSVEEVSTIPRAVSAALFPSSDK